MGARDSLYQLTGMIELDDGFFSTDKKQEDKDQPQKRGRGSQKKSKVLVMAESESVKGKIAPKGRVRKIGHIKNRCADGQGYSLTAIPLPVEESTPIEHNYKMVN